MMHALGGCEAEPGTPSLGEASFCDIRLEGQAHKASQLSSQKPSVKATTAWEHWLLSALQVGSGCQHVAYSALLKFTIL